MEDLRARKSGIALQIQRKLEERYDEESSLGTPEAIVDWVNAVLGSELKPLNFDRKKGVPWRALHLHFRDGIAICKLMSKLLVSAGKEPIKFQTSGANTAFVGMNNIEMFNAGALEYGVPKSECFMSIDLYEGYKGPLMNFINCMNKLGVIANKRGFKPQYEEVVVPTRDSDAWGET